MMMILYGSENFVPNVTLGPVNDVMRAMKNYSEKSEKIDLSRLNEVQLQLLLQRIETFPDKNQMPVYKQRIMEAIDALKPKSANEELEKKLSALEEKYLAHLKQQTEHEKQLLALADN